jgi:hypothetical protein
VWVTFLQKSPFSEIFCHFQCLMLYCKVVRFIQTTHSPLHKAVCLIRPPNGMQSVKIVPFQQQAHQQQMRWPRPLSQTESLSALNVGSSRHSGNISPAEFHSLQQLAETRNIIYEDLVLLRCHWLNDWLIDCNWVWGLAALIYLGLNWWTLCAPFQFMGAQLPYQSSRWPPDLHS